MFVDVNTLDIQPLSLVELRKRFTAWADARAEYLQLIYGEKVFDEPNTERICTSFVQLETTILLSAAERAMRIKGDPKLSYLGTRAGRPWHNELSFIPKQQCHEIKFGDYGGEFYLSTSLDAEGIPNVANEFWEHIVALSKFKNFAYVEGASPKTPSKEAKVLRRSGRSHLFRMLRDFTMHRICGGDPENLGDLEMKWPIDTDWEIFIQEFEHVFKHFAQVNTALYRIRYQRHRPPHVKP